MNDIHQEPRFAGIKPFPFPTTSDVGAGIGARDLCLPSDNKMTPDQQDVVIDIIHRCFR